MSEFHISSDGKNLVVLSMRTGYSVERPLNSVPPKVLTEAQILFGVTPFKPGWSNEQKNLNTSSALYRWYLYEKGVDMERREMELELVDSLSQPLPYEDTGFDEWMGMYRTTSDV